MFKSLVQSVKNMFGSKPVVAVQQSEQFAKVMEAPYKVEAPVAQVKAPLIEIEHPLHVAKPVVKAVKKTTKKPTTKKVVAKKSAPKKTTKA